MGNFMIPGISKVQPPLLFFGGGGSRVRNPPPKKKNATRLAAEDPHRGEDALHTQTEAQ